MTGNDVKRLYLHEVKRMLPCKPAQKKRYLAGLEESVDAYLREHPGAELDELYRELGTPESIGENYLEQANVRELSRQISRKRYWVIGLVILALLAIVISIVVFSFKNTLQGFYGGYYVERVVQYDSLPSDVEADPSPIAEY